MTTKILTNLTVKLNVCVAVCVCISSELATVDREIFVVKNFSSMTFPDEN